MTLKVLTNTGSTFQLHQSLQLTYPISSLHLSPDAGRLYVGLTTTIKIFERTADLYSLPLLSIVFSIAVTADESRLAAGYTNGNFEVFTINDTTLTLTQTNTDATFGGSEVAFASNGQLVLRDYFQSHQGV